MADGTSQDPDLLGGQPGSASGEPPSTSAPPAPHFTSLLFDESSGRRLSDAKIAHPHLT